MIFECRSVNNASNMLSMNGLGQSVAALHVAMSVNLGLSILVVCQSVDVRHDACSNGLWMIGLGRSVDARHGACSGCRSVTGFCRSVDARHGTMCGTFGVHAATAASWLSECVWNTSNERLSFTDLFCVANGVCDLSLGLSVVGLQENQGLSMRTSTRICLSCSSALIRASPVLSWSEMHAHS